MSRIRDIANLFSGSTDAATDAEVTAAIAAHNNATTSVHGITNTSTLATQTYADSAVSTHAAASDPHTGYLKESEYWAAGKNLVINGGMDIWQRNTSFASSNSTYVFTADRWEIVRHGYHLGMTVSRQTAGLDGFRYCARIQRDSGNTSTNNLQFQTSLETSEVLPFINKQMTISFYARKSSTASSNSISAQIIAGTGTDQAIKNYTGGTVAFQQSFTLTDSWQRFSFSGTISSPYNEFGIWFGYTPTGTAGAADYCEITGVQLEVGAVATPFSRAGGHLQGELAACKRYYERRTATSTQGYSPYATGYFNFATAANYPYHFEVEKRSQPTITFGPSVAQFMAGYKGNAGVAAATLTAANISKHGCYITLVPSGTPFTQGESTTLQDAGSAVSYIEVSSEL